MSSLLLNPRILVISPLQLVIIPQDLIFPEAVMIQVLLFSEYFCSSPFIYLCLAKELLVIKANLKTYFYLLIKLNKNKLFQYFGSFDLIINNIS